MKKLLFIYFSFKILANVSYASFPVSNNFKLQKDTFLADEIKQYHSSLIKMGVDLNDCKCESCRKRNKFLKKNNINQSSTVRLYILSGLILLGVIIWLSIGLIRAYNCVDSGDCPQSSGEKTRRGAPIELLWMSLLLLISAGIAIKARFKQVRNKRGISR